MLRPRFTLYPGVILLCSLILSVFSPLIAFSCVQGEQDMIVTAYYSPLPDQKHYYLGSYDADIAFNGNGVAGKDGTQVYPGMIAAPPEFPFGTKIEIPSLGVVGTVHDRGGRIETTSDGIPRIDIWMGEGEEGLARALEWGVRRVQTNVYHPQPEKVPKESFDLAKFPAPAKGLQNVPSNPVALITSPDLRFGTTGPSVAALQYALKKLGYFDHDITSYYGDVTRDALRDFLLDIGWQANDGEIADESARFLVAAHRELIEELSDPLSSGDILLQGTSGKDIRVLQRILSMLNLYTGEIDGIYDQELMGIIFRFQQEKGIVSSLADIGAGMVGPQTRRALLTSWRDVRLDKRGGAREIVAMLP